jgi:hypothetical protein
LSFAINWGYNPPLCSTVALPVSIWDLLYIKTVLIASAVYFGLFFAYWTDAGGLLAGTFPAHQNSNGIAIDQIIPSKTRACISSPHCAAPNLTPAK